MKTTVQKSHFALISAYCKPLGYYTHYCMQILYFVSFFVRTPRWHPTPSAPSRHLTGALLSWWLIKSAFFRGVCFSRGLMTWVVRCFPILYFGFFWPTFDVDNGGGRSLYPFAFNTKPAVWTLVLFKSVRAYTQPDFSGVEKFLIEFP